MMLPPKFQVQQNTRLVKLRKFELHICPYYKCSCFFFTNNVPIISVIALLLNI